MPIPQELLEKSNKPLQKLLWGGRLARLWLEILEKHRSNSFADNLALFLLVITFE